jgi:hypothetical protein
MHCEPDAKGDELTFGLLEGMSVLKLEPFGTLDPRTRVEGLAGRPIAWENPPRLST